MWTISRRRLPRPHAHKGLSSVYRVTKTRREFRARSACNRALSFRFQVEVRSSPPRGGAARFNLWIYRIHDQRLRRRNGHDLVLPMGVDRCSAVVSTTTTRTSARSFKEEIKQASRSAKRCRRKSEAILRTRAVRAPAHCAYVRDALSVAAKAGEHLFPSFAARGSDSALNHSAPRMSKPH